MPLYSGIVIPSRPGQLARDLPDRRDGDASRAGGREGQHLIHACIMAATSPHHRLESAVTACPPQVPSPDADRPGAALPAVRDRVPWWSAGTGVASLVTPVGIGVLHPVLGEVLAIIEVVVVLTIIGTALFGSPTLSERAFRFLRWIGNRPEPSAPTGRHAASPRQRS